MSEINNALRMWLLRQADRDWYDQDEGGMVNDTHDPFLGTEEGNAKREVELQKKLVHSQASLFSYLTVSDLNDLRFFKILWFDPTRSLN